MSTPIVGPGLRQIRVPITSGEIVLTVPPEITEQTLIREIAGQDVVGRRLLEAIDRLERTTRSNRELLQCSWRKLRSISDEFLALSAELRRFIASLSTYHSSIPELEEARGDVKAFFASHVGGVIREVETLHQRFFGDPDLRLTRRETDLYRKKLAKSAGMVRTELQKIFAHLFVRDPRNIYRPQGQLNQKEILFRQFRGEVRLTRQIYYAVRRVDRYMRGAIVPSDLLQMIASRVDREQSISCLFEADFQLFLTSLIDEVLEILVPELQEVLYIDGIWYDDFENIEQKSKMLIRSCLTFRSLFRDRSGLRQEMADRIEQMGEGADSNVASLLEVCDRFRYHEISAAIRGIDQVLVDLEASLLQWEKGLARRAFAQESWSEAELLERRDRR